MDTETTAPAAVAAAPSATTKQPVPRSFMWGALIVAAALPVILLLAVAAVMMTVNYNLLSWME